MTDTSPHPHAVRGRFTLRAKLMLAFVLVSLIGFVAALVILPGLYIWSQNREIDQTIESNAQTLRISFETEIQSRTITQRRASAAAGNLIRLFPSLSPYFNLQSLEGMTHPLLPKEFLETLRKAEVPAPLQEQVARGFGALEERFKIVLFIPWRVPPLSKRISLVESPDRRALYIPFLTPFEVEGFSGTLAMANDPSDPLLFEHTERKMSELLDYLRDVGLRSAKELVYFSQPEMELNEGLAEKVAVSGSLDYWEIQDEEGAQRRLYVPVDTLREHGGLVGAFCIIYPATRWLYAMRDLLTGPAVYLSLGIAALLAVIFSYFFAQGISRPIQQLTEGAVAIAQGRLDRTVSVLSQDEIGVLAKTFNEMTDRLRATLGQLRERAETIEQQNVELDRRFKELTALQNYTENVLSTVDSAIFSVDLDGVIRRPNRAAHALLGLQDGCHLDELASEGLRERLQAALETGETTVSDEMQVATPEGESAPFALSVSPLREGAAIRGAVAVLTDLQTIKNLEALVSRQERLAALGQLTAGVAHELRNPLSIIKACAEILHRRFSGESGENGLCRDIIDEVDRLSRVVSDFLTFARPSQPSRRTVHLNELLAHTLDRVERGEHSGEVIILRELADPLPSVDADPEQIEQVLLNLIRNGLESMGLRGALEIRSGQSAEEGEVWFEVRDHGQGMDEATRRRVFDPFYTTKAEGTGLGLSICHRILEAHGGSIVVAETSKGGGTTFRVSFPKSEKEGMNSDLAAQSPVEAVRS
ncbi:MAG: HAMP domain-containing protein [Candidatus Omnitrophica bacterium]|nr:Adaptive-response sensory-kinase SasA [bacterium]NUN98175.1 HAMP domain-containing protein [Candidatus Omnitrophota bacterium]